MCDVLLYNDVPFLKEFCINENINVRDIVSTERVKLSTLLNVIFPNFLQKFINVYFNK